MPPQPISSTIPFKIDIGNIITIGVLLVSIGISYGNLGTIRDRLSDLGGKVDKMADKVDTVSNKQIEMGVRLSDLERQVYRQIRDDPSKKGEAAR